MISVYHFTTCLPNASPKRTQVKLSVEQILKFGKVVRPILGISFAPDQVSSIKTTLNSSK